MRRRTEWGEGGRERRCVCASTRRRVDSSEEGRGVRASVSTRMSLKRIVLLARVLDVIELLLDLDLSLDRGLGVASADPG